MTKRILVTGAAGFIGHHMVKYLKKQGHWVRGVDWKNKEYETPADEFVVGDLRDSVTANRCMWGIDEVYHLAADMGGIGFIQDIKNHGRIMFNNTTITLNVFEAARKNNVNNIVYSSSACIYPLFRQQEEDIAPLKEEDAYPADAEDAYGWEKLQAEHFAKAYNANYGMDIKVVRFHNIYGEEGDWTGGREKAPAAMCRKVAQAVINGDNEIEMWGDGEQTRSFCYIDDCTKAMDLVMHSDLREPVNVGRDDMISIKQLAKTIMEIEGVDLRIKHIKGFLGVRGRNSDNTKFREKFNWEPEISMKEGLEITYKWIKQQMLR